MLNYFYSMSTEQNRLLYTRSFMSPVIHLCCTRKLLRNNFLLKQNQRKWNDCYRSFGKYNALWVIALSSIMQLITHMGIYYVEIPTMGRSTRMHCISYQNLDNILFGLLVPDVCYFMGLQRGTNR